MVVREPITLSQLSEATDADLENALALVSAPDASASTGYTSKKSLLSKIKEFFLGNTSISSIGDGTVTGAISSLNNDLTQTSELTLTRTENSYVNDTSFNRMTAFRIGKMLVLNGNFSLSSAIPSTGTGGSFLAVGTISGWRTAFTTYASVTCQSNASHALTIAIDSVGKISIYSATAAQAGFYRFTACVPYYGG